MKNVTREGKETWQKVIKRLFERQFESRFELRQIHFNEGTLWQGTVKYYIFDRQFNLTD